MKYIFSTLLLLVFFIPANAQTITPVKTTGCIDGNCDEGTGKYLFTNGDKFNGEWHGGMRSGYGRYDYKNGDWYIGDFKNDLIEGKGVIHLVSGKVISGEWLNYILVKVDDPKDAASINMKLPTMQVKKK
ncbi:hypothetical protein LBMAG27_17850 [Bacteroidota bacterium]|nr:hypothetical protein LBMAG27_17850 [Bacteroidota bacterium]